MKNTSALFFSIFFACFSLIAQASKIYQWTDAEGVRQFTKIPPPLSCKTDSCRKIHRDFTNYVNRNKPIIEQQMKDKKEQEHREKLKKTTIFKGEIFCNRLSYIKEYYRVDDAKKFLIKDRKCFHLVRDTKYSFIEKSKDYAKIRLYLKGDKSITRWIKKDLIVEPD